MRLLRIALWLVTLALFLGAQTTSAFAQSPATRAALVNPGAELERAARLALEPWQVKLVILTVPSPGATAPSANEAARALARAEDCDAVVWISEDVPGHALWVYDRRANQALSQTLLTPPPFDGPTAAAVALSIKTLLRHSSTAPASERFGAATRAESPRQSPHDPEPPRARSSEVGVRSEARASNIAPASSVRPTREVEPEEITAPTVRMRAQGVAPSWLDIEASAAVRAHFALDRGPEARFGGGLTWWPRARWAGVSLRAASGQAMTVSNAVFRGHLRDTTIALAARVRHDVRPRLRLVGAAGVAGEVTVVRGVAAQPETLVRFTPSLGLELGFDWLIASWFKAGLRAGASWIPHTQRYLTHGEPLLVLTHWTAEGALVLAAFL